MKARLAGWAAARTGPLAYLHLSFLVAAFMLGLMGWAVLHATQEVRSAGRQADHTQLVLQALGEAREAFVTLESAQRGYLLTGRAVALEERQRAAQRLDASLRQVETLTTGSPAQQLLVRELRALGAERLAIAREHTALRERLGFDQRWPAAASDRARESGERFRALAAELRAQEAALLAEQRAVEDRRDRQALWWLTGSAVLGALLLLPAYGAAASQARRRLASERRMADLVESLPVVVWQVRSQGAGTRRLVYTSPLRPGRPSLNEAAERGDLQTIFDSIDPQDRARVLARVEECESRLGNFDERWRVRGLEGSVRWIHCNATLRREPDGAILWSGYWIDITPQKQLEEQLTQANAELETFSYSVSHDLRAPLSAMEGFSRVLDEQYAGVLDDRGRHYLARMRAGAAQMGELIDGMLLLARVNRAPIERQEVDLSRLADEVLRELAEAQPTRAVAVEVQPGLRTRGDVRLLRQVMANLLGNAWKFSVHARPARIAFGRGADAQQPDGEEAFYVRDNGAGFDMAFAGKLFGAFQRMHKAGEFPGTGVGLAIVQRIVARHGGRIWARSAPGQGTTVFFTLPHG